MGQGFRAATLQIDNSESLSDESIRVNVPVGPAQNGLRETLVAIIMPASWTTADLTFQASNDDTTFYNFYNAAGTEVTVEADASRWIGIDPVDFSGVAYMKVRSGTSGTPVAQGADRTLTFLFRPAA